MISRDPIKIGLLHSTSGLSAEIESSQLRGSLLAIAEVNQAGGIDGRELVPIHCDPQSRPSLYGSLAERLFVEDGVNTILGGYTSATRKKILPMVEKYNRLLMYPQQYEGFEFSQNIIYSGASPNQNGLPLADFMTENFGARAYLVGSAYVYPYESNRTMQGLLLQHPDGAIVGERYLDLNAPFEKFEEVVADIKKKQPDFIFCTVIGPTLSYFYRAYAQAGLDPSKMPIGSLNTSETEIKMMGARYGAGHFTAAPYFQSVDTFENYQVLEHFAAKYGNEHPTDMNWEAAYYQMRIFAEAYARAGSDRIDLILPHLRGAELSAPQGRIRIDPFNHHTAVCPRIGRATASGQFEILRESAHAVPADPYMASQQLGDWVTKLKVVER
jgi:branched-chain amino acid transport system substrate-binding protein